jgi:hypothetical protein
MGDASRRGTEVPNVSGQLPPHPHAPPSTRLLRKTTPGTALWAEVDYVDAVAGVAVRVVGEHHRGGGAGLVDDLRDL